MNNEIYPRYLFHLLHPIICRTRNSNNNNNNNTNPSFVSIHLETKSPKKSFQRFGIGIAFNVIGKKRRRMKGGG